MDATHAACDGLWVRDLLSTAGPFVLLAGLLLVLAYRVLDPTPPRHAVLSIWPARGDVAEFGARISSVRPVGLAVLGARARLMASMSARVERRAEAPVTGDLKFKYSPRSGFPRWIPPGQIVGLGATNSDESTTGVGRTGTDNVPFKAGHRPYARQMRRIGAASTDIRDEWDGQCRA